MSPDKDETRVGGYIYMCVCVCVCVCVCEHKNKVPAKKMTKFNQKVKILKILNFRYDTEA